MKLVLVLAQACWLLWPIVVGHESSNTTTAAPAPSPTPAPCITNADCQRRKNTEPGSLVICNTRTQKCVCHNRTLVLTQTWRCLPMRMLGQHCRHDEQCHQIDSHAECEDHYCKCEDGYYVFNDINGTSCIRDEELQTMRPFGWDKKGASMSDENMVPIIVCLAIMFVGMCVALQLFSRARFRNQRSVFNSPNPRLLHMKSDSKRRHSHVSLPGGSRRPSVCSQQLSPKLSRPGSRAGSTCGSPNPRRASVFDHHAQNVAKDDGAVANGPSESTLHNGPGSPKVIVNRSASGSRPPSPPPNA
ncbi:uncharacterized protein LOC135385627 [Ornithodoros turicata]|uniref:uncharacterized protein LOC135385627 n=1 Tax=Ornithodoros turicata TaxID=34597 RepID=UPI00313A00E2